MDDSDSDPADKESGEVQAINCRLAVRWWSVISSLSPWHTPALAVSERCSRNAYAPTASSRSS